jgi:Tfp pilus assembly protein PilF
MSRSYYPLTAENRGERVDGSVIVDANTGFRYTVVEKPDGLYQVEFRTDALPEASGPGRWAGPNLRDAEPAADLREPTTTRNREALTETKQRGGGQAAAVIDQARAVRTAAAEVSQVSRREELSLVVERRMDHVMGSGNAARTYLTVDNGWVYQLPLTWYSQANKWDFSPGFDVVNHRFSRLVPDRCMACHNSYPEAVTHTDGKYASIPFGIGCERCHGPGSLHVDERLAVPEVSGEFDDTIVTPSDLPFERRMDVCQQCHLHASVSLLREGRTAYSFRPGQALSSHVALFPARKAPGSDEIGVISHADRMKKSACFGEPGSAVGRIECVTCHEPHTAFRSRPERAKHEACLTCHAGGAFEAQFASDDMRQAHQPASPCVDCHMPRVEVEDAPHSSFTDHWIRVVGRDDGDDTADPVTGSRLPLSAYFAADENSLEGRQYLGIALIVYGRQTFDRSIARTGIEMLLQVQQEDSLLGNAATLLGIALHDEGRSAEAVAPLERAVRLAPDLPERLNALAQVYEAVGKEPRVISRLYRHALDIQPALSDVRVNYGRFLQSRGQYESAIEQYDLAIAERPSQDVALFNLGTAYAELGETEQAEQVFLRVTGSNPANADALSNLGLLSAARGDTASARFYFESAVRVSPRNAEALGNLGAFYVNNGREPRAAVILEAAVELDPLFVDALANLSLALFRLDDYGRARQFAQRALEIDRANRLAAQVMLATE